jgi:hypothetical protein
METGLEVIYEVTLHIDEDILEEYLDWLRPHTADLLSFDQCFSGARLFQVETLGGAQPTASETTTSSTEGSNKKRVEYCVHYICKGREGLNLYLQEHAPKMRAAAQRFTGRFTATRRVLTGVPTKNK